MTAHWRPTVIFDEETLVDRAHAVALIAEGLRYDAAWKDDGDLGRRRAAKRINFARWMAQEGEIGEHDAPPARERRAREGGAG